MGTHDIAITTFYLVAVMFCAGFAVVGMLKLFLGRKNDQAPINKESLWLRGATLMVLAPLVLLPCCWGIQPFAIVVSGIIAVGLWEVRHVLSAGHTRAFVVLSYMFSFSLFAATLLYGEQGLFAGSAAITAVLAGAAVIKRESLRIYLGTWCGVMYVSFLSSFLILLRSEPNGFGKLVFFLLVIHMADFGALFGGLATGRHMLVPKLSPAKTWEGLLIGSLAAVGMGLISRFAVPGFSALGVIVLSVIFSISGLLGDLFGSFLKRGAGIKNFGNLLPGHGGLLDRFDGYLISAPIAWILMRNEQIPEGAYWASALIASALIASVVALNRLHMARSARGRIP